MKTEYSNKYEKINKFSKTILTKPYHATIKQKNFILSNYKKVENNNSSILNKKNLKNNKLNINQKLNIIKESNDNKIFFKNTDNKRNNNNSSAA